MAPPRRGIGLAVLPLRPETIDVAALGDLYDRCGERLFRLAHLITGDSEAASSAVVRAFELACTSPVLVPTDRRAWNALARLTYVACQGSDSLSPSRSRDGCAGAVTEGCCMRACGLRRRALLALTMHGNHHYREAADFLGVEPSWAASLLRRSLRDCLAAQRGRPATPMVPPC